jgi:CNT family concentrative nucleoside transporter
MCDLDGTLTTNAMPSELQSLVGFIVLLLVAWMISERPRILAWRTILAGVALQFVLAALFLKVALFKRLFMALNEAVNAIEAATQAGTTFVFGYLGGGLAPFAATHPEASFVLAFRALPLILVVSALSSLLFYWRVLPFVVKAFSKLLEHTMGIGGAVGLGAAANVFVGMVEAPLLVRPYLSQMSRSELFITMSCGMAGIAGTVMVLYASILGPVVPDAMGHILIASIVSAPAAIVVSVLMVPPERAMTSGELSPPQVARSAMDAVTQGTTEGVNLLINVTAMLIVLVALVHLANQALGLLPHMGSKALTLQGALGWVMAPVVWLVGIPWSEAHTAGALMGPKTVLNEFVAYLDLARLTDTEMSARSRILMTYALCGFANLGSLGILLGGMGAMVPARRDEIIGLGAKSIVAGTLATCLTGATVGMLL